MRKKYAVLLLGALMFGACASGGGADALVKRGIPAQERKFQAENQFRTIYNHRLVDIYVDGYVAEGMTDEMVQHLWGEPDRTANEGKTWEYVNKKGAIISIVKLDSVAQIKGEEHKIVTDIQGDRYGGSSAPK